MQLILLVVAGVLFLLSAFNVGGGKLNFQSAGLFCWVLSLLVK